MIKTVFNKPALCKFLCCIIVVCLAFKPVNQANDIVLHAERLTITPKEFYIANVIDERDTHNPIAQILQVSKIKTATPKTYAVDLHNGNAASLKQFMLQSLSVDK